MPAGAVTLRSLVEEGRLRPPRPDLAQRPPPRIRESNPVGRAALGYLAANCGGCHNDRGPLARLGFVLQHDVGGKPEAPERGALLHRMQSRRPSSQMPPLGTVIADQEAIELVRRWIQSLNALPVPESLATNRSDAADPTRGKPPSSRR